MLAARNLLGWSRERLAGRLEVPPAVLGRFETAVYWVRKLDLNKAREVLEAAGVEFINEHGGGAGVGLRKTSR